MLLKISCVDPRIVGSCLDSYLVVAAGVIVHDFSDVDIAIISIYFFTKILNNFLIPFAQFQHVINLSPVETSFGGLSLLISDLN